MPKLPPNFAGGQGITGKPTPTGDDLLTVLQGVVDDLNALRAAHEGLAAKWNAANPTATVPAGVTITTSK